ncbi:V-type ATPase subunit [Planctomycetota bacterium]
MSQAVLQSVPDFYGFPAIGGDDFRYAYATGKVRALRVQMLTKTALQELANAGSYEQALETLSTTEYAVSQGSRNLSEVENILLARRTEVRELFEKLMIDKRIVELFKARDDFANMRLLLRRTLTEKPIGSGYSGEGNVSPDLFEGIFELEKYELLPDYLQTAVERAILAYYHYKDIRHIDYEIDRLQAQYNLETAEKLNSIFLTNLFKLQIDMTNMRTMLRLKFTDSEKQDVFLSGGFIANERLKQGLSIDYDAMGQLFFVTPYYKIVSTACDYLASQGSFLKAEQECENYIDEFLQSTLIITAGHQPLIAYLLEKEKEIRTIRLILTARKNSLDTKLILDRISV